MRKTSISFALITLFALVCFAADLTGTYKGTVAFDDNELELIYRLKADGEMLSGSISSEYGEIPLMDGKISGSDFSYKIDIGNGPLESKGKFYGDSIVIQTSFGDREVKHTFKKVTE